MKNKDNHTVVPVLRAEKDGKADLLGYPLYPAADDIFVKGKEESDLNPEETTKAKESNENEKAERDDERDLSGDMMGSDLDVPGSELDDDQETIGNEDEENNYYSLGGDNHNDLDEDKGD